MEQLILAIDIGSSKICSLIADLKNGTPHIIGVGVQQSRGVRKGTITNIEQASSAIRESVNEAKRMAGTNISQAYISLSGACTKSTNMGGIINNPNNDIGIQEINRVMQTALYNAKSMIPSNYEVIHVLPYFFKLDDREYVDDPFGMSGARLEVSTHIVYVQKSALDNLKKVVKNAGIEVIGIVLNAYASSIAVLNNDEKEMGVGCIDMGASSCDIMIHHGNSMQYDDFLGVGSGHITNDIVLGLNTPIPAADMIKIKYATLNELTPEDLDSTLEIPTNTDDSRRVSLEILHSIVFSRVLETLQIIEQSIERSGLRNNMGAGIVITGGMAYMNGLKELAKGVFMNLPIRIAEPKEVNESFKLLKSRDTPYASYSTAVGLILYASGKFTNYELDSNKKLKHTQNARSSQKSNLSDLEVKENDLTDLEVIKNKEDDIRIKKIKEKRNGVTEKVVDFFKKMF
ncbi:cell division protein FtsA [Helicobacter sp. MIT 14-3879]|uniref:cell division protein FtsA n=1 Tax=Helicobacter sp. MIT 14-3879 TaxID=2040649 RepID=UPI0015F183C0|nr:cell division protein FtsA [Helicobacter sp. MIT 14-3879]